MRIKEEGSNERSRNGSKGNVSGKHVAEIEIGAKELREIGEKQTNRNGNMVIRWRTRKQARG